MKNSPIILLIIASSILTAACSTKIVSNNSYQKYRQSYDSIEQEYLRLYRRSPFAVAYVSKDFEEISLNLRSDTLTRVYGFNTHESRLSDSLVKYKIDTSAFLNLLEKMKRVKCTWVNNFDYYTNNLERRLVYLSIRPLTRRFLFSPPKYIVLAYFPTPQLFDKNGILLDSRRTKKIRKVNGYTFRKVTDRICYTIAENYR